MDHQVQEDYVPILGYHFIKDWNDDLTITEKRFEEHVDYLTNNASCNWITMNTLASYVKNGEKLPTNTCIMNFDDGAINQYTNGLCILNQYKVPATYYIEADHMGEESEYYMSKRQIDNLYKMGHDIQSHTLTHPRLANLEYEEQEIEILDSKTKLESLGYENITSFAYPYGSLNDDTLDILRKSDYVLARDITQRNTWKEQRAPVISFNEDYLLHFYYIKPEYYTAEELWDAIGYTGWWQFEDNYKKIAGEEWEVLVISTVKPTNTSYGSLKLPYTDNEISTQFITKYEGAFTLDILAYNSTENIPIEVEIDGVYYEIYSHEVDSEYSLRYNASGYVFYNFYVNIDNLLPGIHKLNIIKLNDDKLYLDKFRLFSNINQDFTYESYYKECNPKTDEYCYCDWVPPIDISFNSAIFFQNLRDSLKILAYSIIVVLVLICSIHTYFNCNKRNNTTIVQEHII